jgi:hypothetical protein
MNETLEGIGQRGKRTLQATDIYLVDRLARRAVVTDGGQNGIEVGHPGKAYRFGQITDHRTYAQCLQLRCPGLATRDREHLVVRLQPAASDSQTQESAAKNQLGHYL